MLVLVNQIIYIASTSTLCKKLQQMQDKQGNDKIHVFSVFHAPSVFHIIQHNVQITTNLHIIIRHVNNKAIIKCKCYMPYIHTYTQFTDLHIYRQLTITKKEEERNH